MVALKRAVLCRLLLETTNLTAESVQGTSLAFQSVDDIHSGDGLSLGVLAVCDGITDDVLKEHLQYTTSLFVDETRDTLDTTTAGQTTDGWLGDTLDVITQHLTMTLGASLSKTLSSFATSRHDYFSLLIIEQEMTFSSGARCLYTHFIADVGGKLLLS